MAVNADGIAAEEPGRRALNPMRLAILTHRYLGIAVGFVVSAWCLSAFVMLYVQYPEYTDAERVASLDPLSFESCCPTPLSSAAGAELAYPGELRELRVEMLGGRPALRIFNSFGQQVLDLATGDALNNLDPSRAQAVSRAFAGRVGLSAPVTLLGMVERDQWTVYASYHPHRPLYHFAADDAAGTQWYVSGPSGEVVQITTARDRFWNWLGAVTHWIYFTGFREHTAVWAQTVIWLTIVATFLTVLGLYIGIKQIKRRRSQRWTPYRGFALWHHITGLVFGVLVLTWLVSGFFSMNPWGALEGRSFGAEYARLRGGSINPAEAAQVLQSLPSRALPESTVRIESTLLSQRLAWVATNAQGQRTRLDAVSFEPAPLRDTDFEQAAIRMRPEVAVAEQGWLGEDDSYYYSHHEMAEFPVYRIIYADGERFYLDAASGELIRALDTPRRWYRWLFEGLHRGDFARLLRARPVWDLFMLPLLFGVTLGALTGTWMGIRRLRR